MPPPPPSFPHSVITTYFYVLGHDIALLFEAGSLQRFLHF
jgi:hypothetical protein